MRTRPCPRALPWLLLVVVGACDVGDHTLDPDAAPIEPTADPRKVGLGGESLVADRPTDIALGDERLRIKPYGALQGEYERVLGAAPAGLAEAASSFGTSPPRSFLEPSVESGALRTAHDLALAGCDAYVADRAADFAGDAADAAAVCDELAAAFWSRPMLPEQRTACLEFAASVVTTAGDAAGWTRVCAAVLSSAGFLTY
ncbi:MAG: hypothetical protein R2939_05635 [Kofleriaceae bacterium]